MTTRLALVAAAVCGWSCSDRGTAPVPAPPPTASAPEPIRAPDREESDTPMKETGYPNVRIRLRTTNRTAAVDDQVSEVDIWLKGQKFHIRDHACRPMSFILQDVTDPGGLGRPLESIEEMMDVGTADRLREGSSPTEIYGDLASDRAWVQEPYIKPYDMEASELAPIAEQVLARGKTPGLKVARTTSRLGRAAAEYRGMVDAIWMEEPRQNEVTRVVAPPFLLYEHSRPPGSGSRSYTREILVIEEGVVTDADVTPPAAGKPAP